MRNCTPHALIEPQRMTVMREILAAAYPSMPAVNPPVRLYGPAAWAQSQRRTNRMPRTARMCLNCIHGVYRADVSWLAAKLPRRVVFQFDPFDSPVERAPHLHHCSSTEESDSREQQDYDVLPFVHKEPNQSLQRTRLRVSVASETSGEPGR